MASFNSSYFLELYRTWRSFTFPAEDIDMDELSDLKYDIYELDTRLAGYWIRFVESDFKDVADEKIQSTDVETYIEHLSDLKKTAHGNDVEIIEEYLSYLNNQFKMINVYNGTLK